MFDPVIGLDFYRSDIPTERKAVMLKNIICSVGSGLLDVNPVFLLIMLGAGLVVAFVTIKKWVAKI